VATKTDGACDSHIERLLGFVPPHLGDHFPHRSASILRGAGTQLATPRGGYRAGAVGRGGHPKGSIFARAVFPTDRVIGPPPHWLRYQQAYVSVEAGSANKTSEGSTPMFDAHKALMLRPILAALVLALLVFAVVGGIAWNVATPLWPSQSVDHTRQVLAAIDDLRVETDRAESRQWAYFLTRDRSFLAERDAAITAVSAAQRALGALTIDNSAQQLILKKLGVAVDYRAKLFSGSQASLNIQSANDVAALIRDGRAAGDAVRAIMQQLEDQEKELLTTRQARERTTLRIVFTGIALMLTFVAMLALRLRRSNLARLADEQINQQVNDVATRDITAQKQAAQYARSLIEASLDPLVTISPDGKIMDVNAATVKVTGVTREELLGSDFSSYFTEPAKARDGYQQVFAKSFVADYPLTIRQRDGKLTDVLYNASVYKDVAGNVLGVFAAARDITERKLFETSLQAHNVELEMAKAVAEKANLAKSDFLSSMSHELRTPLNAVLGFAQLIESSPQTMTPAQKLSIDQILKAGWHLLTLINEILDLAIIESGKASMSIEPVSLHLVLQDCHAMIEPLAQKRGIQMTFPNDEHGFCVRADRTRLKQVIINLLSNAIKYNRANGAVILQCAVSGKNRIRISVEDTGAGLSAEQLAQLFQAFNRLGREAGTEEGSGIGLVVTKQLVELMNGEVGVESRIGVGSTFWIDLDAMQAQALSIGSGVASGVTSGADEPDQEAEHALPMQRTLLYVEDEPANLLLVQQLIAQRGDIKLLSAINGDQGIEMARAHHPEVILMDINLPGISGFDVIKLLHEDSATAHITIMALSANAMPLDVKKGLKAGFFRYLTKPIKIGEFMNELDAAFLNAAEKSLSSEGVAK